jgi:hypothetical protein
MPGLAFVMRLTPSIVYASPSAYASSALGLADAVIGTAATSA